MVLVDSHRISPVPRYSGYLYPPFTYAYRTITFFGPTFQMVLLGKRLHVEVLQPPHNRSCTGLGSSAFARHYLRNHCYFLFLRVLRCFSSPGLLTLRCDWSSTSRVAPFRNLRITSYVPIPAAYRSLSRLSSPLRA